MAVQVVFPMHRALQIFELIHLICGHLRESEHALCRLACVCRLLSGPALDNLWAKQDTLMNILRCMPDDLWEDNVTAPPWWERRPYFGARRAIEPQDWTRFHVYAGRVKSLSIDDSAYDRKADTSGWSSVFEMLAVSLPIPHMFPNLRCLNWNVHSPWFSYVRLFLAPRLESLHLEGIMTPAKLALLPMIPVRCPLLKSVDLVVEAMPELTRRPRSLMILGLRQLETFKVSSLDQTAIRYLAQLPKLENLDVKDMTELTPYTAISDTAQFCGLHHLNLGVSPRSLLNFLAMNSNWSLGHFEVNLKSTLTADEFALLFRVLAKKCNPTRLSTFMLDTQSCVNHSSIYTTVPVLFGALHPLLCFHHLRTVALWLPGWCELDDTTVETLARSWPKLESLELRRGTYGTDPCVTLRSLRVLAHHCPELSHLCMPFDASRIPALDGSSTRSKAEFMYLHVEDAALVDPAAVATYLMQAVPNLKMVLPLTETQIDEAELRGPLHERLVKLARLWAEVDHRLRSKNSQHPC
ncbi:hypothetical protein DFH06DRAFT_1409344 [Mycena polygramma]|nr:hypothetical protein DFH06DRAFT_1409344 [Mycena polygramma]